MELSHKGQKLINFYQEMAENGYDTRSGSRVETAYNTFELRKFRLVCRPLFQQAKIKSVLDYGGGGSDWSAPGFDQETGQSAQQYFDLEAAEVYEPARDLNNTSVADCVVCMDVLEHIFVCDLPKIIQNLFSLAQKLLVINVACYEANALLPNGENAHVTVRDPMWWRGIIDGVAVSFPSTRVMLICSETYTSGIIYVPYAAADWYSSPRFTTDLSHTRFAAQ